MVTFDFNKNCYGCRNCANICPTNAIKIIENKEGFLIPKIDKDKCINCGACEKVCPFLNFKEGTLITKSDVYAAFSLFKSDLKKSTSGGIFYQLGKKFIENGDYVCGCIWNKDMEPIHYLTNDISMLNKMRGSKYVQSDLKQIFKDINITLKNNKKVLFSGTPCQVAAIKLFTKNHENLFTCSLVCEGVPSAKVWKNYKNFLEKKYNGKLIEAYFRNKELGWSSPVAKYIFSNNKVRKTLSFNYDFYVLAFLQGLFYRNSCSNCQYKGNGHNGDIIIGDFWGIDKEMFHKTNDCGVSCVIVNSNKGKTLFDLIKRDLYYETRKIEDVCKNNKLLMTSIENNKNRKKFFENIDNEDIVANIKKNIYTSTLKNNLKEGLFKVKLFRIIKNIKNR